MISVRQLSACGLFNFMAEPTPPLVFEVGEVPYRVRGSILVTEEHSCIEDYWIDLFTGLENSGRMDSCVPVIIYGIQGERLQRVQELLSSDTINDAVLCITAVHVLTLENG